MRILVVVMLLLIIISLFTGLFFMYRDKGKSRRVVIALTFRITLSIITFVIVILGLYYGWFQSK